MAGILTGLTKENPTRETKCGAGQCRGEHQLRAGDDVLDRTNNALIIDPSRPLKVILGAAYEAHNNARPASYRSLFCFTQ